MVDTYSILMVHGTLEAGGNCPSSCFCWSEPQSRIVLACAAILVRTRILRVQHFRPSIIMPTSPSIEEALHEALIGTPNPISPETPGTPPTRSPGSSTQTPRTVKRRRAITDAQRKALRNYFRENIESKPSQKDLEEWFNNKYDHKISQSSISEILSPKWAYLDQVESLNWPDAKKRKTSHWPDLEDALFHWYQIQLGKGVPTTIKTVKEMAAVFWHSFPQYRDQQEPCWSAGWFYAFKSRYRITLVKDKALGEVILREGTKPPKR